MKMKPMYKYVISFLFFWVFVNLNAQEKEETKNDTLQYKTAYGLRLGIDLSKPVLQAINSDYSGLEFVADYRISKNWYIAAEFGTEQNRTKEDYLTAYSEGSYIRLGVNNNVYKNWLDMNNEIFTGFRYGFSTFDQTLESYTINTGNVGFLGNLNDLNRTDSNLSAHWFEMMIGIKVETFKNLFVSFSGSYKLMISVSDPDNFKSLYAPGFNRIYASNTGFGFNYTISYLIPFKKK